MVKTIVFVIIFIIIIIIVLHFFFSDFHQTSQVGTLGDPITLTQFQWPWPAFEGHRPILVPKLQNLKLS